LSLIKRLIVYWWGLAFSSLEYKEQMCHLVDTKLFATRSRTKEEKVHERQYPHVSMQLFKSPPSLSLDGAFEITAPQHGTHASASGIIVTPSHLTSDWEAKRIIAQPKAVGSEQGKSII
jgi:hypothetical protein